MFYKPGEKALYIVHIGDRNAELQVWESEDEIRGSLVMRSNLKNLELELIGQKLT